MDGRVGGNAEEHPLNREPEHRNKASDDQRTHITGVALDKSGDGKRLHFEIRKRASRSKYAQRPIRYTKY